HRAGVRGVPDLAGAALGDSGAVDLNGDPPMKSCRHCGNVISPEHTFCLRCGKPIADAVVTPPDVTAPIHRLGSAGPHLPVDVFTSRAGALHRSMAIADLFALKSQLVIG